MIIIDKYAYSNNLIHTNPNIRFVVGMIFLLGSMLIKNLIILSLIILLMSVIIVGIAKIDIKGYIKLLKIPMIFLIMSITMTLINISNDPNLLIKSFCICSKYIGISNESLDMSLQILFRSMSCLTCVYFIMLTIPFNQLLFVFKSLHIPTIILELSMLIYRFIFIFLEEVSDIRKSQELRFGYINLKTSYKSFGLLGNLLYKRMMIRYEEMCISLDMKLYDDRFYIVGE